MPYLQQLDRDKLEHLAIQISMANIDTPGKLNYLITLLIRRILVSSKVNYTLLNGIVGALESCKHEFYLRIVLPYEERKCEEHGDVYPDLQELLK